MLSAAELLAVWERGLERRPFERAVILLEAACPESSSDDIAELSIGGRDDTLLRIRETVFGPQLTLFATCPQCSQQMESRIMVDELRMPALQPPRNEAMVTVGAYQVRFRPLNAGDIASSSAIDSRVAELALIRRCIVNATVDGSPIPHDRLPDDVVGTIQEQMAELDPSADMHIRLTCAGCSFSWLEPFDIVSFFWIEIDAWARRLLGDVHTLASSYGWTEREILALSPVRRQYYLELVNG